VQSPENTMLVNLLYHIFRAKRANFNRITLFFILKLCVLKRGKGLHLWMLVIPATNNTTFRNLKQTKTSMEEIKFVVSKHQYNSSQGCASTILLEGNLKRSSFVSHPPFRQFQGNKISIALRLSLPAEQAHHPHKTI
jgi:hypothetical protein